jgi:hypothetical protein
MQELHDHTSGSCQQIGASGLGYSGGSCNFVFYSIFAGLLIGFLGTHLLQNKMIRDKSIFTKLDGAKRNPAVQELVIAGWSFNQPTA